MISLIKGKAIKLVGVVNVTPDSFSDGGLAFEPDAALARIEELRRAGADIIELGAESTAPGSTPISASEEISRLEPLMSHINKDHVVAIDTYKSHTARYCLQAGARLINDVSALRADPELASVVAEFGAQIVVMYSKEDPNVPHASASIKDYVNIVEDISTFLRRRIDYALKKGIKERNVILDTGMGRFISHNPKYSWELLGRYHELTEQFAGFDFMIATSRKGFLGGYLSERDLLSFLTSLIACAKGATYVRTHNLSFYNSHT